MHVSPQPCSMNKNVAGMLRTHITVSSSPPHPPWQVLSFGVHLQQHASALPDRAVKMQAVCQHFTKYSMGDASLISQVILSHSNVSCRKGCNPCQICNLKASCFRRFRSCAGCISLCVLTLHLSCVSPQGLLCQNVNSDMPQQKSAVLNSSRIAHPLCCIPDRLLMC